MSAAMQYCRVLFGKVLSGQSLRAEMRQLACNIAESYLERFYLVRVSEQKCVSCHEILQSPICKASLVRVLELKCVSCNTKSQSPVVEWKCFIWSEF